jgi:hypothetical protein
LVGVDRKKIGKNGLIDFFLEGLGFVFIFLALAFDAMSKNFVEEDGAGSSEEDGGAGIRLAIGAFTSASRGAKLLYDLGLYGRVLGAGLPAGL